ncbi:MAG: glucokinase [Acetobacteraceae bacterium]
MQGPTILADIGATNARFAVLAGTDLGEVSVYPVAEHATPADALRAFLTGPAADLKPRSAALAAAGPLVDGRISMLNAGWTLDPDELARALQLDDVRLLNDFEALAWSLPEFGPSDLFALDDVPRPGRGTMAVIGPGTGFGMAAVVQDTATEVVLVTEGGHATLACTTAREEAIVRALREEFAHVSVERVLSGSGLEALYRAVAKVDGRDAPPREDAAIVAHALAGDCENSRETLLAFCGFLGGVAGDTALTLGARGGVFIGGGITPRFTDFLRASEFRARFEEKGRLRFYQQRIPTAVIMHRSPAFLGLTRLVRMT